MSCESCADILKVDGVEPDCFDDDRGCPIPQPGERGRKILEIRARLISLQGLVDPGTILRMYDAGREDIDMLAFLEEELREMEGDREDIDG